MDLLSGLLIPLALSLGISTGEAIVDTSHKQAETISLRETFKQNQAYVKKIQEAQAQEIQAIAETPNATESKQENSQ